MDKERIEYLAIENADRRIKEVDKNSLSAIADYDRGLREGFIDGYKIAINNITKSIVNDYIETKRNLLKDEIIAINTEEVLNSGKAVKINGKLINQHIYIEQINGDLKL